jgi:ElaB/YqjD/DUF883 family membrane-anchored ribosome-binding protein
MSSDAERVLNAIKDAVVELEALAKSTAGVAGERAEAARENVRERFEQAADKVRGLEQELRGHVRSGAKTANDYVRDNPWRSLGITAAVAFLLGAFVSRRD